jgi:hypothetical protein
MAHDSLLKILNYARRMAAKEAERRAVALERVARSDERLKRFRRMIEDTEGLLTDGGHEIPARNASPSTVFPKDGSAESQADVLREISTTRRGGLGSRADVILETPTIRADSRAALVRDIMLTTKTCMTVPKIVEVIRDRGYELEKDKKRVANATHTAMIRRTDLFRNLGGGEWSLVELSESPSTVPLTWEERDLPSH